MSKVSFKDTINDWEKLGQQDPFWAVLTDIGKKGNKWHIKEFYQTGKIEINTLSQELESKNIKFYRGKALDFGCGVGRLTNALADHFQFVVGVDAAKSMIRVANKYKAKKNINYVLNREGDLKTFKDKSFDFIYSNKTLQHIPPEQTKIYIRELIRLLKPKGVFVFYLPSEPDISLKGLAIRILPENILDIIRGDGLIGLLKILLGRSINKFGMYPIDIKKTLHYIRKSKVKLIEAEMCCNSDKGWKYYRYILRKL